MWRFESIHTFGAVGNLYQKMHFAGSNLSTDPKCPKCIYKISKNFRVEKSGEISRNLRFSLVFVVASFLTTHHMMNVWKRWKNMPFCILPKIDVNEGHCRQSLENGRRYTKNLTDGPQIALCGEYLPFCRLRKLQKCMLGWLRLTATLAKYTLMVTGLKKIRKAGNWQIQRRLEHQVPCGIRKW